MMRAVLFASLFAGAGATALAQPKLTIPALAESQAPQAASLQGRYQCGGGRWITILASHAEAKVRVERYADEGLDADAAALAKWNARLTQLKSLRNIEVHCTRRGSLVVAFGMTAAGEPASVVAQWRGRELLLP